jgi:uncharacterized membrane protein
MNLSILLSILCAIAWGIQAIFLKLAMRDIPLYSAVLISLAINFLIVAVFIGAGSEKGFSAFYAIPGSAYVYFMIAGVLNYFLGRTFYYSSFRFIGVAQARSISSTYPIFSVVLAILAALSFGTTPILVKKGLRGGLHPFYGVTIAIETALLVNILFVFLSDQWRKSFPLNQRGLLLVALAAGCNTAAALTYFGAMSLGKVSMVVPISCIYPLFTIRLRSL